MLDEYTPPPRREAPPALTNRIQQELLATSASSRFRVVLPIAAAVALVAGVAGAVAAQQLPGHHDTVVVEPAVSPTPHASKSPGSSPTAQPKVPRPMTKAEIAADEATCLSRKSLSGVAKRHGKVRVAHARVERPISNADDLPAARYLAVVDAGGSFVCIDGVFQTWSADDGSDSTVINKGAAAWQDPVAGMSTDLKCRAKKKSLVQTDVLLKVDPERVVSGRVTITVGGNRLAAPVSVAVHDKWIYAPIAVEGGAAWKNYTISVEALDKHGTALPIQPYVPSSTATVTKFHPDADHCE